MTASLSSSRALTLTRLQLRRGPMMVQPAVSLHVNVGEVVTIVGRNGVGKTTLTHCLAGWLATGSGEIEFAGRQIQTWSASRRCRAGLGIVPDSRELFWNMTVRENLMLAWRYGAGRRRPWDEFEERIESTFPSISALYRRRCASLSGGQQQLVTIARALATAPTLLVMDEPTFGLSPSVTAEVLDHINVLRQSGLSVLLCEQSVDVATDCADAGYVMNAGHCSGRLSPGDLLSAMYDGFIRQDTGS